MTPVMQTIFLEPTTAAGQQRGNCWTACVASLLELPIDRVPNFVQIDVDGGADWFSHTISFLHEHGHDLYAVDPHLPIDGHYIQTGISPRTNEAGEEIRHAVIYQSGSLAHDPHPSGAGLIELENAYEVRAR